MRKVTITITATVSNATAEQLARNGCELVRQGDKLAVKVPNRAMRPGECKVEVRTEDVQKEEPPAFSTCR
jgi:hypothetical protein